MDPEQLVRADVKKIHDGLWRAVRKNCEGLSPTEVALSLHEISERMYDAGIDKALEDTEFSDLDNIKDAYDFIWLTLWAVDLAERRQAQ